MDCIVFILTGYDEGETRAEELGIGNGTSRMGLGVDIVGGDERRLLGVRDAASLHDVGRDHVPGQDSQQRHQEDLPRQTHQPPKHPTRLPLVTA